ncbi:MAG: HAMP domain-containing histidine kinase, partial [Clostridia bacterium]|nr:HAMP domain-containing histidine kinase [Clostridia bacterium]
MLKTLYSKYLVSFIVLLGVGFFAIAIIICSVVTTYSINTKTDIMNKTAQMVYLEVSNEMNSEKCDFETAIKKNSEKYGKVFKVLTEYSESNIVLFSSDGRVLYENAPDEFFDSLKISSAVMDEIKNGSGDPTLSDLGGFFQNRRFNYIYPVEEASGENTTTIGYIVLSSSASGMSQVFEQIIKVIIIASLWVFLAAIIIVYFITDRITTPIKQISKAVKQYARGNFDVRIPVSGEDEIATLAEAFNNMASDLSKLEKTRNTFFSSVSHDLKTPMTSIQGFIEGILDGTIPEEKQSYYLGIVLDEVKRLTRLVNSLLDVTRMQSGSVKLNPTSFDICEMARLILISFEEKIDSLKLNIEFNC